MCHTMSLVGLHTALSLLPSLVILPLLAAAAAAAVAVAVGAVALGAVAVGPVVAVVVVAVVVVVVASRGYSAMLCHGWLYSPCFVT